MEDNSVLNEDSNIEDVAAPPRKSISQPSLADKREAAGGVTEFRRPTQGLSKAVSATNVRSIPIIKTWEENEQLKGEIYTLKCEVQRFDRKYSEAKEACHKSVQEVLDEYVEFKIAQDDYNENMRKFHDLESDLHATRMKLDNSQSDFARQAEEFEQQKQIMEKRIRELEASVQDMNNTTCGSLRGTLDDIIKRNDPDFTLTSGYEERRIAQLENDLFSEQEKVIKLEEQIQSLLADINDQSARLAQSEHIRAQLEAAAGQGILGAAGAVPNSTFVIGNARESQTEEQIKYIDELETKLTDAKNESEKARLALVEYMNRCSKLENEIHRLKKNSLFDSSSILVGGKTSEELRAQIDKVNGELNELRAENRDLRIRCDQLTGGDGNLSTSLGQSRLMAGISSTELASSSHENETGNTSMRMIPRESELGTFEESKLPLMDTSAAVRSKNEFDAAYAEFEALQQQIRNGPRESIESSFNASMPPPNKDATQSFLSQKSFKNSPMTVQKSKPALHQKYHHDESADQIQNNSFSTKYASPHPSHLHMPILNDMQQILDSSAILLEGQHDAVANVEKMQLKMAQVRDALSRLFERLKSSAALFEDILEKMGSSSPLAERIKQMKLAFETSISDHADVSIILEAAEKDLANMSNNFSILEKSIVSHSFVADLSRRFTIAPEAEDVASSSLLNASYSPIFKFSGSTAEVEKLQHEVSELKSELEKARARELKSPLHDVSSRLSDVQITAAHNFEELEVAQATLKKVESEKVALMHQIENLETAHHKIVNQLDEVRSELDNALTRIASEQDARVQAEEALHNAKRTIKDLQQQSSEHANEMAISMETRVAEACQQVEANYQAAVDSLKHELKTSLAEENAIREQLDEMRDEMNRLRRRTKEAEDKVEMAANEKQDMVEQLVSLENQLEKVSNFELQATDCTAKIAARKKEIEVTKHRDELEHAAIEGLEKVRKEVAELTKKQLKAKMIKGNASSISLVCEELCRRIVRERELQHECAETMKYVNENIEKLMQENEELKSFKTNNENAPPSSSESAEPVLKTAESSNKKVSSNFVSPTRQLLHESTMAVDAIVQRLKKTHTMAGMGPELKETIANLIIESRTLRDFLHQKLILFKGIDMTKWKNESVDQLVKKLAHYHQDNLMLEEQIKKYKKELKETKAVIPTLGRDVEQRIKKEIGGIAKDMGAVKQLRKK